VLLQQLPLPVMCTLPVMWQLECLRRRLQTKGV